MQVIGIATQLQTVVAAQLRNQLTDIVIGPKNVGPGCRNHIGRAGQLANRAKLMQKLVTGNGTSFISMFQIAFSNGNEDFFLREF